MHSFLERWSGQEPERRTDDGKRREGEGVRRIDVSSGHVLGDGGAEVGGGGVERGGANGHLDPRRDCSIPRIKDAYYSLDGGGSGDGEAGEAERFVGVAHVLGGGGGNVVGVAKETMVVVEEAVPCLNLRVWWAAVWPACLVMQQLPLSSFPLPSFSLLCP